MMTTYFIEMMRAHPCCRVALQIFPGSVMRTISRRLVILLTTIAALSLFGTLGLTSSPAGEATQDPKPQSSPTPEERGIGVEAAASPTPSNQSSATQRRQAKPEIVLQAGITSPQTQIRFSPDGRLLASMGMSGSTIKLWEIGSGRLLRQLESNIPSLGASSHNRPFRFTADGKALLAVADGRVRRWDVENGREVMNTALPAAKETMSAILSDDGRILAAVDNDGAVRLWDISSNRALPSSTFDEQEQLNLHNAMALTPDGRLLAVLVQKTTGGMRGIEIKESLLILDVASGKRVRSIEVKTTNQPIVRPTTMPEPPETTSVAFTSDGAWVAWREGSVLKVWDTTSGRAIKTLRVPENSAVNDPAFAMFASQFLFSHDKKIVSLTAPDGRIALVDPDSSNSLATLTGHEGMIVALGFSADGRLFASSGLDNQIKLWEVSSGRELRTLRGAAMPVNNLAFTPDGKGLALSGPQGVGVWEMSTGSVKRSFTLSKDLASLFRNPLLEPAESLSPDGQFLVSGMPGQSSAKLFETATGREVRTFSLADGKQLDHAVFSSDSKTIILVEKNIASRAVSTPAPPPPQTSAISPGQLPDMSKLMEQMKKDPKKLQAELKKVEEAMNKGDLSAGLAAMESLGMMPAAKSAQPPSNMRIVEVTSGRELRVAPLPAGFFDQMAGESIMAGATISFSPDGKSLAAAVGFNGPLKLIEVGSGKELRTFTSPLSLSVSNVAWSPDGAILASAQWGLKRNLMDPKANQDFSFEDIVFSIRFWNPNSGAEIRSLTGHNNFITRLAFSRDGRILASGSFDGSIILWDVNAGRELTRIAAHNGSVSALAFSPNGDFLVSGSDDGSARVWRAKTGELLATMVNMNNGVDWLVVTPDGLFDGSPGGWNQILWRFSPTTFDVSPVEIFFNEFFHPGLLADIFAGRKLAVAADVSQKDRRQPKLTLTAPEVTGSNVGTRKIKVRVGIDNAPAGARDVRLFRNGSLVKSWRGDVLQNQSNAILETEISIIAGENNLTAYAFNRDNVKSTDATLQLFGAESLKRPATLHVLVAGVNEHVNSGYNLKYAVADGQVFAEELERQQRKLGQYAQIEITRLFDREATKANLLYALSRLTGKETPMPAGATADLQKLKPAQPEDAVVVYFAGHGTAQEQRFYLIPHDMGYLGKRTELDEPGLRQILNHSISDLELEQAFAEIDASLLVMVVDACNSGQALEAEEKRRGPMNSKGLAQLAYEKGMYILTAAQSYQAALEAEQLGHGYLTFALVEEGLKAAKADQEPTDGDVFLREWLNYATDRVPQMQQEKMRTARGLKIEVAFVEGEERVTDIDKRSVQRPRVFYRREAEIRPMLVARP